MSPNPTQPPRGNVFDDRGPIYRQIADQIRADVLRGALKGDEQIMSTNQYAAAYRINPATAAKAFHELISEGTIYKKRGVGMFVHRDARETLRAARRDRFLTDVVDPMVTEAVTIGIPLAEVIARIRAADDNDSGAPYRPGPPTDPHPPDAPHAPSAQSEEKPD